MKKHILISILFVYAFAKAQTGIRNSGNLKIHNDGQVGFHTDLINDGASDNNEGFAGFYNQNRSLSISGDNQPIFNDFEVAVDDDLFLLVSTGVRGIMDFTSGRVITPRNDLFTRLEYPNDGIYDGESDDEHVDGYVLNRGSLDFIFPIGDDFRLRPLGVTGATNATYQSAYFFENPNNPSTFPIDFRTDRFEPVLSIISTREFWDLNGAKETQVTLTWDNLSDIPTLADDIASLRVVGFNAVQDKWIDLGAASVSGDLDGGSITSEPFIPDTYRALTFGSLLKGNGDINVYTIITPNGDGINDTLVIEGIATNPNNVLTIYNRWGVEVYRKRSYDNSFGGISQGRSSLRVQDELPVGTYYYVLELEGQQNKAGAFYINR